MRLKVNGATLNHTSKPRRRVFAADEENEQYDDFDYDFNEDDFGEDDLSDTLDDVADTVEDIQDTVDDIEEDDVNIEIDNNIANHYIAECDSCHGVFISATVESDQKVEKVSGTCPLCEKETDQYLKWVIKDVNA